MDSGQLLGRKKKIIRNYKQKSKLLLREKMTSDRAHSNSDLTDSRRKARSSGINDI